MPYVTNANIYAPVMMLAEKAADLILGNTPIAPEDLPFYRHGRMRADSSATAAGSGLA
jgi:choline dehydrogenase